VSRISDADGIEPREAVYTGWSGGKLFAEYSLRKFGYRNGRYAQIREDDYAV